MKLLIFDFYKTKISVDFIGMAKLFYRIKVASKWDK